MSFHFACPYCSRNNYCQSALPVGNNYFTLKCTRCGITPIYWVASEQVKSLLISQKVAADPRSVVIGGRKTELADAEPGIAIGGHDDLAALLQTKATLVGKYSHGERIAKYQKDSQDVKQGVCEGQCLHWIRRVLQGGRHSYDVPQAKKGLTRTPAEIDTKERLQHVGGATVHRLKKSDRIDQIYEQNREKLDSKMQTVLAQVGITMTVSKGPEGTGAHYSGITDANKGVLEKAKQIRRTYLEGGIEPENWSSLAKELDVALVQAGAAKKRAFANIVCEKVKHQASFDTVAAFADVVLKDSDFKVGCCAFLSVGLLRGIGESGGAISGHATAIHFAQANQLVLFDPNVGMFSCSTTEGLKTAIITLIELGWVKIKGWRLDGQFGYSLFKTTGATQAANSATVIITPAPGASALINKPVLPAQLTATTNSPLPPPPLRQPVTPAVNKSSGPPPPPPPASGRSVSDLRKAFEKK